MHRKPRRGPEPMRHIFGIGRWGLRSDSGTGHTVGHVPNHGTRHIGSDACATSTASKSEPAKETISPAQYTGSMVQPSSAHQRSVDDVAVAAIAARLARQSDPPWLHVEIARRMSQRLALFKKPPQHIVDWSSWLGGGASLLAEAHPRASLTAVEEFEPLVARTRNALRRPWWSFGPWAAPPKEVLLASSGDLISADLIWSNMLLHGVKDPPALFERWRQMLSPEGFVMFSCLGPGALRGLKDIYHRRGWPTHSIEFVDMHDLGDMLVRSGFADPVMDQETLTIQWDSPRALCDDLRLLGGNASPARFGGLRTSRWLASLHNELQILKNEDGKLSLEFEIVYGHAFKASALKPISVETRVPLEEMRRLMPSAKAAN